MGGGGGGVVPGYIASQSSQHAGVIVMRIMHSYSHGLFIMHSDYVNNKVAPKWLGTQASVP